MRVRKCCPRPSWKYNVIKHTIQPHFGQFRFQILVPNRQLFYFLFCWIGTIQEYERERETWTVQYKGLRGKYEYPSGCTKQLVKCHPMVLMLKIYKSLNQQKYCPHRIKVKIFKPTLINVTFLNRHDTTLCQFDQYQMSDCYGKKDMKHIKEQYTYWIIKLVFVYAPQILLTNIDRNF